MHAFSPNRGRYRPPLPLIVAITASIGLHAAALGLHGPAGTAAPAASIPLVLQAFLAPVEPPAETPTPLRDTGKPGSADESGRGGDQTSAGMPAPDRWFKRSELDAVATPAGIVKMEYPEKAKTGGAAQVQVRLFIDERGVVRKVAIESAGPERAFEEEVARVWRGVRFSPAMKDGVAVKSQQVIEIDFQPDAAAFR